MMILILSMRHNGTHFMMRAIGGYPAKDIPWAHNIPERYDGVVRAHLGWFDESTVYEYDKIVIPKREKKAVLESHRKYRLDLSKFDQRWQAMEDFISRHDCFVFDMETKPFSDLEAYLGFPVNRDTSVIRRPRQRNRE